MFPTINKKETGVNLRRIMDMRGVKGKLYIVGDLLKQIQYQRINTKRFRLEKRKSRSSRYLCKVFRGVT